MPSKTQAQRKRGRPPAGKKAYCIRMLPETHDVLMQMADWEQLPDLSQLLDQFAEDWTTRMKYARSEGRLDHGLQIALMCDAFDAQHALDGMCEFVEANDIAKDQYAKSALLEVKRKCERLIKLLSEAPG